MFSSLIGVLSKNTQRGRSNFQKPEGATKKTGTKTEAETDTKTETESDRENIADKLHVFKRVFKR